MNDMTATIIARSDQLNADDLLGRTLTIKVTKVLINAEADQPVSIHYEGDAGKPYKICKSMRRVLVGVWGPDANNYIGRTIVLYRDEKVRFGPLEVGGIRISHLSNIDKPVTMALTASKANKKPFTVHPYVDKVQSQPSAQPSPPTSEPPAPNDYADLLEFDLDTATTAEEAGSKFNAATKTEDWNALKAADPERADSIKAKAKARVSELRGS